MTFFEQQQAARRKSAVLIVAFIAAVLLVCVAINAAAYAVALGALVSPPTAGQWLREPYWLWISIATVAVIGFGSARTVLRLRGGGERVAALVGARPIAPASTEFSERRLVNVVEEMAIASGTPVPAIYVMEDEAAINAFAAGVSPSEAALIVTAGALSSLDRDQLQGVVAHEFSHILCGDMRLNVRLTGVLAGLVSIGRIGRVLMRSEGSKHRRVVGRAALAGLVLYVIGYLGLLLASLIKAAISRQREYLADASAVQFTRNPQGIAGALWKIAQSPAGSQLLHPRCEDIDHFCFAQALGSRLTMLMATHPPVEARIRAIDPLFDVRMKQRKRALERAGGDVSAAVPASAAGLIEQCGRIDPGGIAFAGALLAAMPERLLRAIRSEAEAPHVVLALLLADAAGGPGKYPGPATRAPAEALLEAVRHSGRRARLPLLNMALPALRRLTPGERKALLREVQALIEADDRYTVFEFAALVVLRSQLGENAGKPASIRYRRFAAVLDEIHVLLSVMARLGSRDEGSVEQSFRFAMGQFDRTRSRPLPRSECTLNAVGHALETLARLAPMLKRAVLQASADCVIHDGKILISEADMLQALAVSLDVPLPPLVTTELPMPADSAAK